MFEVVAKTRIGWTRRVGLYSSQSEAERVSVEFANGEGVDTMVRPVIQEGAPVA